MELPDARLLFAKRLREARLAANLTQEALGVAAGLSVDVARVRINRYEKGGRECDLRTAQRLADALGLPLPALFTDEDDLAEMIIFYSKISKRQRQLMLAHFKGYFSKESKIQGDHD
ncbi:helix-turn-helix transcriptional regulator [Xanthomonas hortorum pv. vitians]|uniref:helix-turn-helix domain-containing protein n=1 Tax=Xanthomonas hortorum TaxID=56454 RepID=UPI0012AA2E7A|nr:helix-turn-helix transcriptional regulator [Xanthomonas hortorum]MCE4279624.1 helix-turn-helix transcriptional regulator [Xanthomonas hortorum pv. vitians]MCE4286081.1 helix-turn-helix transcriptional regulator [Xanthomonas hortorum pv. vitians]QEW16314.1 XRE family transcriptional regulator [Xanthomonas hortorum]